MAEDYAYACQRAELLGLPIPSEEEWKETRKNDPLVDGEDATEAVDDAVAEDLEISGESMQRVTGGLDELNTILSATQKKLNRFKVVCGSLSSLLRVGSRPTTPNHKPHESNPAENAPEDETLVADNAETTITQSNDPDLGTSQAQDPNLQRKINLNEKMGSHLDKLDSLISKAENAQYSMKHQTKQMQAFLK